LSGHKKWLDGKEIVLAAGIDLAFCTSSRLLAQSDTPVIHQLRIYEIPKQNREVFHNRFRDHAKRIMEKYDFHIVAIWESVKRVSLVPGSRA